MNYSYFYRTFPPDDKQAEAMIDLVIHFGWDHISTINSNNLYGQRGIEEVKKHASANGICIDFDAVKLMNLNYQIIIILL